MAKLIGTLLASCLLALSFGVAGARGQTTVDDPPLFIGSGSCPTSSCGNFFNGETVAIPGSGLTIYNQGANSQTLGSPFYLIIGVPNVTNLSFAAPSITVEAGPGVSGTPTGTLGGANTFLGSWNTTTGYAGQLNSGSTAYAVTGLTDAGSPSESFSNWSTWDSSSSVGINASTFAIYVYTISGVNLSQTQYVSVDFGSSLPVGTFAVAYGCEVGSNTSAACDPKGNLYSTPFTHAGIVVSTPEPGTLVLLAAGLAGLVLAALRRRPLINV